jgi:hypothetical protein
MLQKWLGISLALMACACASAPTSKAFDPREWRGQHVGEASQVLTLGSAHLNQTPNKIDGPLLVDLLDRLAAFNPTIITYEGLSGEQCDVLERYVARYPGMFENYCWGNEEAQAATGLNEAAAGARIIEIFKTWPSAPNPAQRRELAAVFMASGDRPSALVQWLQIPVAERKVGDGMDAALVALIEKEATKRNETQQIAVPLAVRLGLQRVYGVDDHTADAVQGAMSPDYEAFMQAHWSSGATSPISDEYKRLMTLSTTPAATLAFFRHINLPETGRDFVKLDYFGAANRPSDQNFGRVYVAWWETRNLRMVANIREAFGTKPGSRVLNIVGASHKPYYDAYLSMMPDVKVVDAQAILQ